MTRRHTLHSLVQFTRTISIRTSARRARAVTQNVDKEGWQVSANVDVPNVARSEDLKELVQLHNTGNSTIDTCETRDT